MLDLYKLHAFVVVVEERNITHAANRLFIQQPPLTRLLKKLEQELGTQLLIRQPRGIEPTEAGLIAIIRLGLRSVMRLNIKLPNCFMNTKFT
ncbi:LysR family transcriptional regulator [Acinetobacter baumannii]|nr:LysR family transcriptional regulator [Acinetobacter baumannii]MBF7706246.1 LysR family transcriptional regulator [Acinetobacter baumannii]MBF7710144.1 LysR family transcriptional regulator [Acinetobacter baumannii]MBF7721414.1 LysR family transcriptional regulator [Acinetobacter baumannii]